MSAPAQAEGRAAVILAAGASERMGRPKADLPLDRSGGAGAPTFLMRALELAGVGCPEGPVAVVGRAAGRALPMPGAFWVANPRPERGMFSSVQVGLRAVSRRTGPHQTLLLLVDHPLVQRATVRRLWAAAGGRPRSVVVPVYAGRSGHPVVLPAEAVRRVLEADENGRLDWLLEGLEVVEVGVGDPGVVRDIDTPGLYARYFGPLGE